MEATVRARAPSVPRTRRSRRRTAWSRRRRISSATSRRAAAGRSRDRVSAQPEPALASRQGGGAGAVPRRAAGVADLSRAGRRALRAPRAPCATACAPTYHQPILRTMCARAGARLMLDPGTGVPVVYGIDVHPRRRRAPVGALDLRRRPAQRRAPAAPGRRRRHLPRPSADHQRRRRGAIGAHVHVADDVYICGYDAHPMDPVARRTQPGPVDYTGASRIVIEDDAWICQGVDDPQGRAHRRAAPSSAPTRW